MVDDSLPTPCDRPLPAPSGRELALASGGLVALVALQLLLANGWYLFSRHFWLDELYTYTLVADPDRRHALAALADGVETHPPTPYLLLRGWTALLACQCEGAYRLFSLVWMLVGLLGLYVCLRQSYGPRPSAAAVLVVWAHTELLYYAFEARAYAPWFAAAIWFACALGRCRFAGTTARHYLSLAVTAAGLCSLHYLAVLTWVLVLLGEGLADRGRRLLWRWPVLLALACGPLAWLAGLPFLFRQRAALTVPTWIPPPDGENLWYLAESLAPLYFIGLVLAVTALGQRSRPAAGATPPAAGTRPGLGLWGLTALGLLPLVLVIASFLWQPLHHPRYALPALAAFAPVLAWAFHRVPARTAVLIAGAATLLGTAALHGRAQEARTKDQAVADFIAALRAHTGQSPVIFEMSVELLVVCHYAPDLADRCFFLDFDEHEQTARHPSLVFGRDLARVYARHYERPALVPWRDLRRRPSFFLVCEMQSWQKGLFEPRRFPGFRARLLDVGLYEMQTNPGRSPTP